MKKFDTAILDAEKSEKEKFIIEQMKSAVNSKKEEKEKYYASISANNVNVVWKVYTIFQNMCGKNWKER